MHAERNTSTCNYFPMFKTARVEKKTWKEIMSPTRVSINELDSINVYNIQHKKTVVVVEP